MIGEKGDPCFILVVPYHGPSQGERIFLPDSHARGTDDLVFEHIAVLGDP